MAKRKVRVRKYQEKWRKQFVEYLRLDPINHQWMDEYEEKIKHEPYGVSLADKMMTPKQANLVFKNLKNLKAKKEDII